MNIRRGNWFVIIIIILVLFATNLPYLYASISSGEEYVFGGFLINPRDGNSYLAKMYQGWSGSWRFSLPYTAQQNEGVYLFMFYLALGHISRVLGLSLIVTFHAARIVGTLLMLLALNQFIGHFTGEGRVHRLAFAIAVFGSGLGWIAMIFGGFTSDFWVVEAYPFLSAYATPHFAFGLALLLGILTLWSHVQQFRKFYYLVLLFSGSLLLGIIAPFNVIIALAVMGGYILWGVLGDRLYERGNIPFRVNGTILVLGLTVVVLGGGVVLVYDYWVTISDTLLSVWNMQNQTSSPPVWDIVISLTPAILLAVPGMLHIIRRQQIREHLPLVWTILGIALIYIPWSLQRRFTTGIYIPIAILAAFGVDYLSKRWDLDYPRLVILLFLLILPTNLFITLAARHGAVTKEPLLYLTKSEYQALTWIENQTPREALILASPDMGMFIPARSGRRVIYGHPFETVNAENEKELVEMCYEEGLELCSQLFTMRDVDYVFIGPRERALGEQSDLGGLSLVFQEGEVAIYHVEF